ncbi:DDE-type integrase/transposase/recombinase [Tropicimonas sp. IMCC6043]|uniref:DDE-type integrase/transposase/recombinase n=1 Tax=Tropicimonas sp. IMCC6043 TaxID=2510645 RepID=UPI00352FB3A7
MLEDFVTKNRDRNAALEFSKISMKRHCRPHVCVTDKLRSYSAVLREVHSADGQGTGRWRNNRAENSHLPFRRRERTMQRFRRIPNLQVFAAGALSISERFDLERCHSRRRLRRNN